MGHAYSAYLNREAAQLSGGVYRLRIEDIDFTRRRADWVEAIFRDLDWLGLLPESEPLFQSKRRALYRQKICDLEQSGLAYPCFCTRSSLKMIGGRYAGTCKPLTAEERQAEIKKGMPYAMRLDMAAISALGEDYSRLAIGLDDCIIARKDIGVSYHIAVTADDLAEGITHVIRGEDLAAETPYHRLLFQLYGATPPIYFHHTLIRDEEGGKLAKSKGSTSLQDMRSSGIAPQDVIRFLAQLAGESGDLAKLTKLLKG